jgi:hypothetical protein
MVNVVRSRHQLDSDPHPFACWRQRGERECASECQQLTEISNNQLVRQEGEEEEGGGGERRRAPYQPLW